MTTITEYTFENYGFTLPAAFVEVIGVRTGTNQGFYDNISQSNKNSAVRVRVWASEQAKLDGMQALEETEKFINLDEVVLTDINTTALSILFPAE